MVIPLLVKAAEGALEQHEANRSRHQLTHLLAKENSLPTAACPLRGGLTRSEIHCGW